MTADEVIEALRARHHPSKGWITVPEVSVTTGFIGRCEDVPDAVRIGAAQRLDLFAMHAWPSGGFERICYEVKVSRSDFLAEMKAPHKREVGKALAHHFMFAVPRGLVELGEIPDDCGLAVVDGRGVRVLRKGPRNPEPAMPLTWAASLLRTASEQRSIERRCGARGCMRPSRYATAPVDTGVPLVLCEAHWEQMGRHRARQRSAESASVGAQ